MPQNTDNHAFYLTQIHQLKELQKLDDQIYEVQQILEKAPDELRDLQDKLTKAEVQRDRINDKISHLKESESRISREREENSERLKKSKSKLMNTGNEKEFSAVTREIDNLEKMTQPREDELLAVRDELRNQNDSLNELNEQYIDLKTQVEARKATLDEQLKSAKDRLAELDRERDESSRSIPALRVHPPAPAASCHRASRELHLPELPHCHPSAGLQRDAARRTYHELPQLPAPHRLARRFPGR